MPGAFGENFPYTNFHDLNLDWIIGKIKELETRVDEFELKNQIHYEGGWDEHEAYTKYAIVSDGTYFYMSQKDTPPGILLTNQEYWLKVIDIPVIHSEGEWSANKDYTPLAIVTAGNVGFMARKDVPRGTSLSNTEYWHELYNLSAPGEKRYIFIGDSYGAQAESWIDIVIDRLGLVVGSNAFKKARASYGFIGDTAHVSNPTFISLLNEVATEITAPESITDIIVGGGHNDAYSDDAPALLSAINAFIARVHELFPNAYTRIGFIAYTGTAPYVNYANAINQYQYASNQGKTTYLTETEKAIHSMYFLKDDMTHPNQYGALEIANAILRCLNTGNATNRVLVPFSTQFTPSGLSTGATLVNNKLYSQISTSIAGNVRIEGTFPAGSRPTWTCSDAFQEIASFDPKQSWIFGHYRELTFEGTIHIYNGTNYYHFPCTLNFYHGKLYASFPVKKENSTSDMQLQVTQFKINRVGYNLPFLGT